MKSSRFVLAFLMIAVAGGGGGACRPAGNPVAPPAITAGRQALDEAVIEAVLVDVVAGTDEDAETIRQEQGRGRVLFSVTGRDAVGTLRQELPSAESESWKLLSAADRAAAREAWANVIARIEGGEPCAAFRPGDARLSVWEDDPASTRPVERFGRAGRPRPVHVAPPGYGDRRRLAVVTFGFSWSMHGGDATYVLRYDGARWVVIARHYAYYV